MAGLAIIIGGVVWCMMGSIIGQYVVHKPDAAILPGLVCGIWAAWPCFHEAGVNRYNFLHPVPKEYAVPVLQAFTKVKQILSEVSYNFGDHWRIVTADTQTKRILAHLRYTDEETKYEFDGRGHMHTRRERMQRFIALEVQMKDTGKNTTIIQLDFMPTVEGTSFFACDSIITGVTSAMECNLGPGEERGSPADKSLPAPPWWLLGLSALTLIGLGSDILKAVFQ